MARKYFFLLLFFAGWFTLNAQNIAHKQFSLIGYNLELSKDIRSELIELDPFISEIKTYNDPGDDKLKAILVHTLFFTFKEIIERDIELEILPTTTFMNDVKYDDYGYPTTSIRKALRKGYSHYYFKLDIKIESMDQKRREENPERYEDINYTTTYPRATIHMTIFSKDGIIPVYNLMGTAIATKPLPVNDYILKGFDNTEMNIAQPGEQQADNIYTVFYRATKNLIQDYYNQ
ncbi:MAG: hypothetical protein V2I54_01185 [Bacteroidales bacterium]|jgi:hypothetical protein|nr:hypothetical protein [Bacteroidales bacterium]